MLLDCPVMFCDNCLINSWYRVNYAMADTYQWGKDLGCDFVTKSCMHWMSQHRQRFDDSAS